MEASPSPPAVVVSGYRLFDALVLDGRHQKLVARAPRPVYAACREKAPVDRQQPGTRRGPAQSLDDSQQDCARFVISCDADGPRRNIAAASYGMGHRMHEKPGGAVLRVVPCHLTFQLPPVVGDACGACGNRASALQHLPRPCRLGQAPRAVPTPPLHVRRIDVPQLPRHPAWGGHPLSCPRRGRLPPGPALPWPKPQTGFRPTCASKPRGGCPCHAMRYVYRTARHRACQTSVDGNVPPKSFEPDRQRSSMWPMKLL